MARVQTFLARLGCLTLAAIFAVTTMARAGDWPSTIVGIALSGFCFFIFIFDVFGRRLRQQFPFLDRFQVKPIKVVITEERTRVYYADGTIVLSLANQIVWRPEAKGPQVLAVGAPAEWLPSTPRVLPLDAIHTDLIAETVEMTPRIDESWEAFLYCCLVISWQKVGFRKWFFHQFFSVLIVELQIRDHLKRQLIANVVRKAKRLGPHEVIEAITAKG